MFVSLRIVALPEARAGERAELATALAAAAADLPGARSSFVAPVVDEAAINGGDLVWRLVFASERDAQAVKRSTAWRGAVEPLLAGAEVTTVGYRAVRGSVGAAGPGVWRVLLFRVTPQGFPDAARQLEDGLLLFPKYIPAIRNWGLNPVAVVEGPKAFTHVWEQEFDSLEGLTKDYMDHPIHWAFVDAWFDAEYPQYVVDPALTQVTARIDRSVMDQGLRTRP
jgi:hypothetical protein